MKKLAVNLFITMMFLGAFSLHADQGYDVESMIRNGFGIDISEYPINSKAVKKQSVSTDIITHQYTTDGWLQHVAVYSDGIICTNVAGPREGLQIVIIENGAMDMCHSYKKHRDYKSHKYSWGEVRTYDSYQTVIFN